MSQQWIYIAAIGCIATMEIFKKLTSSSSRSTSTDSNASSTEFQRHMKQQINLYSDIKKAQNISKQQELNIQKGKDIQTEQKASLNELDSNNEEHKDTDIESVDSKTNSQKTEADDDDDDAKALEEEEKERKKLLKDLAIHKSRMKIILYGLLLIDIVLNVIMLLPKQTYNGNISILSFLNIWRITYFASDTYDLAIATILRIKLLIYFINITIYFGDIKNYDQDREDHKYFNIKRITKVHQTLAYIVIKFIDAHSIESGDDLNEDEHEMIKNDNASLSESKDEESSKLTMKTTFDADEVAKKMDTTEAGAVADFWKTTLWIITFLILTIFEAYLGIKIVFFHTDDEYQRFYKMMFALYIAMGHLEVYFAKKYIDDACKPDNQYFNLDIHGHPLTKKKTKGNWCRLCWERRRVGYMYYCRECHHHFCSNCWKKKRKAKQTAENQLRSDKKGAKKKDDDVTMYEYFIRVLGFHGTQFKWLSVGLVSMLISSVIGVFTPKQRGKLLDKIIEGDMSGFYFMVSQTIIFTVITGLVGTIEKHSMERVNNKIQFDIQNQLFVALISQDMTFYDGTTPNNLYQRMNWGLRQMLEPFQGLVRTLLQSSVTLIGSLIMCWSISWRLTLLGMSTLGPMSYITILFQQWNRQQYYDSWRLGGEISSMMWGSFDNIKTVRAYAREPVLATYYKKLRKEQLDKKLQTQYISSINRTITSWIGLVSKILITWSGGLLILRQQNMESISPLEQIVTIGAFITFRVYWQKVSGQINEIRRRIQKFAEARRMAKEIFRTLDNEPSIETACKVGDNAGNEDEIELKAIDGDIRFEDVHFHYQMSPKKKVLKGVDLTIPIGKVTALVGRSGGGKSTMMHMLLRYYDPVKGSITINGVDIKTYNPYSLRRLIALVAQENEMFSQSIEYNMAYGVHRYNDKDIEEAATLANAHEFILKFDDKYDTKMGSKGTRVSGGQKQRINIARMLMAKPKLMLLDEATSSLDAESEALVQAALDHAIQESNCTVVLVAHRLSTVVNADKICVVDDGQIVEEGTHDELIEKDGIYARLVHRQMNLQRKMKEKVADTKSGKKTVSKDEDYDNIDKLIEQIKKEKEEKKRKEEKEKNDGNDSEETKETETWDHYDDLKLLDDEEIDTETESASLIIPTANFETKSSAVDILLSVHDADGDDYKKESNDNLDKNKKHKRLPMSVTDDTKENKCTTAILEETEAITDDDKGKNTYVE